VSREVGRSPNVLRRVEVYLDGGAEPSVTLAAPPFRVDLDTLVLADGPHTLRIVQVYEGGGAVEQSIPFVAQNRRPAAVTGLTPGEVVHGRIAIGVDVPDVAAPVAAAPAVAGRSPSAVMVPALLSLVAFVGVWLFFVFMPIYGPYADRVAAGPAAPPLVAEAGGDVFVKSVRADITGGDTVLGRLAVGTRGVIEADDGDATSVVVEGWSMQAGPASIFHSRTQRIAIAALTDEGVAAREILEEEADTFGTVWQRVAIRGSVPDADLVGDLGGVWEAGAALNASACGACHVLHAADSFTVNQWPGTLMSYVPSQVSLTDSELELLTKYLQYHAKDM
jgi:hypothetical protein